MQPHSGGYVLQVLWVALHGGHPSVKVVTKQFCCGHVALALGSRLYLKCIFVLSCRWPGTSHPVCCVPPSQSIEQP